MSKVIDKVFVTVRRVETMYLEISEDTGYNMPEGIMAAHKFLTHMRDDISHYIQDVDHTEAVVELFIDKMEVVEEGESTK